MSRYTHTVKLTIVDGMKQKTATIGCMYVAGHGENGPANGLERYHGGTQGTVPRVDDPRAPGGTKPVAKLPRGASIVWRDEAEVTIDLNDPRWAT